MFSAPNPTTFARIQKAFAASSGVTTDTRTASADKLFFALKGENFDGNLYAKEALAKGCIAVVMDDPTLSQHLENAILVEDALKALQALAQWHRRKWDCPVIGLTGSNGKTTTKELLKMVCQNRFPGIQATHGNLNNEIGVPLTLLSISNNPDFVIVEMGANAQGEIELLAQIAEPTHGIITGFTIHSQAILRQPGASTFRVVGPRRFHHELDRFGRHPTRTLALSYIRRTQL